MKILKYDLCTRVNHGTQEAPRWEEIFTPVEMDWSEANEEIAKSEAHNGLYSVEDTGEDALAAAKTTRERLDALEKAVQSIPALISSAVESAIAGIIPSVSQ